MFMIIELSVYYCSTWNYFEEIWIWFWFDTFLKMLVT